MTEYWVSQGNKWCDFCKIYISNNPLSIRNHELGKRHKDNVTARLTTMRKESAAKEKEMKQAAKVLEQIESKAQRSYMNDLRAFEKDKLLVARMPPAYDKDPKAWELDASSGWYLNSSSGYFYDPKSRLYYSEDIGKWANREELYTNGAHSSEPVKPSAAADLSSGAGGPPPGPVVSNYQASRLSKQPAKGATSSVSLAKRKRQDEKKPKPVSKEEAAALKAREEARKRVEAREKHLLGLYDSY